MFLMILKDDVHSGYRFSARENNWKSQRILKKAWEINSVACSKLAELTNASHLAGPSWKSVNTLVENHICFTQGEV